ncbi:hypothetical protein AB0A05_26835 [Streptomyces sp. NPDC046374]|uniref:hypothetical protein n=1 Tax=Streptomyces sp. NPDC046374 TaxID=3154917 RepID=UPI0033F163DD
MRQLVYGQVGDEWEFHGTEACAARLGRRQPEEPWAVTLRPAVELAEELRGKDAAVGESTRISYCSCLGDGARRTVPEAPRYEPEW